MSKAEITKQFIIEKAAPLFMINGVAGTSMSDIMDATKLAKGSLYIHFENKEDLSYAAVDYNFHLLGQKMLSATRKDITAKAKLLSLLDLLGDPLNTPVEGGCPMLNFGMESDDTNPVIRTKVNNFMNACREQLISLVETGITNGEFRKNWNAQDFSIKMFTMVEGAILVSRVAGNDSAMKAILRMLKKEIDENTI
jgi:TetR/AcrR family transcriptional repressor of nem operon